MHDTPRRLPLCAPPEPGESFASWIDRIAGRNRVSRADMWEALRLAGPQPGFVPRYGVALDDRQVRDITAATGYPDPRSTTLAAYDGICTDTSTLDGYSNVATWARRWWLCANDTSACPRCLAETSGVWKTAWKIPWLFGCPTHRVLLSEACPSCATRWRHNTSDERQTTVCVSRPTVRTRSDGTRIRPDRDDICGTPAADAPAEAITSPATAALLSAVTAACDPDGAPRTPDFFTDLIDLCRLVAHIAPPDYLPIGVEEPIREAFEHLCAERDADIPRKGAQRGAIRAFRHTPTNPATMAALLHIAWPIADAEDPAQPIDRLLGAVLASSAGRARWTRTRRHWQAPERLAGAFADAHLRRTYRGAPAFDGKSRHTAGPRRRSKVADRVPQIMWPKVQEQLEAAAPALAGGTDRAARRYTSMALMRLADPTLTTWPAAAVALGLPPIYDHTSNGAHRIVGSAGQLDALTAALHDLLERLSGDEDCPDFTARRAAMAGYTEQCSGNYSLFWHKTPRTNLVGARSKTST